MVEPAKMGRLMLEHPSETTKLETTRWSDGNDHAFTADLRAAAGTNGRRDDRNAHAFAHAGSFQAGAEKTLQISGGVSGAVFDQ